jgi:hypothetical protein
MGVKMISKTKVASIILFFSASIMLVSCGEQKAGWKGTIEEENGVTVVKNSIEPLHENQGGLTLKEEYIIDLERDDLAEIGITDIRGFDVDSEGNIYFWCFGSSENFIFKFDANGNFAASYGRKGQGPGEFSIPVYLRINERDEILVSDLAKKKLVVMNNQGDFLEELQIAPSHFMVTLLDNNNLLAKKQIFKLDEGIVEMPIVICNSNLEDITMLHQGQRVPNGTDVKEADVFNTSVNTNAWSISKGQIYIGNKENGYEFLIFDFNGGLKRKIRKEYSSVKISRQIKQKLRDVALERLGTKTSEKLYFPDSMPPFQFFFTDDEGRLYVMTWEKGEGPRDFLFDIFNSDGLFIGRISLSNGGNPYPNTVLRAIGGNPYDVRVKNNRLYYMRGKESGYQELVVNKMTRE